MIVRYTAPSGRLTIELDVTTGKQAFEFLAAVQELFEEPDCGCCKGKNIACECRTVDENKYYALKCSDCGAQLEFGQKKDGKSIFAKRRDKDTKQPLPNRGWHHWQKQGGGQPARSQARHDDNGHDENPPF